MRAALEYVYSYYTLKGSFGSEVRVILKVTFDEEGAAEEDGADL